MAWRYGYDLKFVGRVSMVSVHGADRHTLMISGNDIQEFGTVDHICGRFYPQLLEFPVAV